MFLIVTLQLKIYIHIKFSLEKYFIWFFATKYSEIEKIFYYSFSYLIYSRQGMNNVLAEIFFPLALILVLYRNVTISSFENTNVY